MAYQERLAAWRAEKDRLEAELARQIPEMNLERRLQAVDRQVVALALPEGTTLVEFVRFLVFNFQAVLARGEQQWAPARYMAFVLPAGQPDNVQMVDLGEAAPIDQMIATYRHHLVEEVQPDRSSGALLRAGVDLGSALRTALFDPVANVLHDDCHHWLLAPDGALSQMPFEVLPHDTGGYLADTMEITYLSSGRDVLRFDTHTQVVPTTALIAADPDFDLAGPGHALASASTRSSRRSRDLKRGGFEFVDRLSGTAVEGERIAALLGVSPWLAETVLETPLKAAHSPRILHLATHGASCPTSPLMPAPGPITRVDPGEKTPCYGPFCYWRDSIPGFSVLPSRQKPKTAS